MSKKPEEAPKRVSENFRIRMLKIIEDDEAEDKTDFAQRAGVSKSVITRATVYGIIPTVPILIKIANYSNVSFPYLLGESDTPTFYKSDNPTTFHKRLKQLTEERNTTYPKIANTMPFPSSYFYDWINRNSFPSVEFLKPIADYFKVSIDYLLGRTDYKN